MKRFLSRLNELLDVPLPIKVPAPVARALSRLMLWLGHYQFPVYLVLLSTNVMRSVCDVAGWKWFNVDKVIGGVSSVSAGLMVLVLLGAVPYHQKNLCPRDIREATELLDPQGEIDRKRSNLRGFHWMVDNRSRKIWLFLVLLLPMLLATTVQELTGVGSDLLWNWFTLAWYALVQVPTVAVVMWMSQVHWKLEPWCPFCHRGDGRDYFESVDPTQPTGRRSPQPA